MPLFSNSFLHYLCMATMARLRVSVLVSEVLSSQFPSTTPTSNTGAGHESWHAENLVVTGLCHENKHYLIIETDDMLNNLNNSSNGSTYPRADVPIWLPPLDIVNLPYKEPTAVHRPLSASGIKYLSIKHSTGQHTQQKSAELLLKSSCSCYRGLKSCFILLIEMATVFHGRKEGTVSNSPKIPLL